MDVKAQINSVVEEIKKDPKMLENFTKDPIKTVEKLLGVDLPDDKIKPIVDGVKAKISVDKLGGVAQGLKNLF